MDHAITTLFERSQAWSAPRLPSVLDRIDERLDELSRRLGDRTWLDGDVFTAGDLLMVAVVRMGAEDGMLDGHPNLIAYVERGTARPAFAKALGDQMTGFTGSPPPEFAACFAKQEEPA